MYQSMPHSELVARGIVRGLIAADAVPAPVRDRLAAQIDAADSADRVITTGKKEAR